MSSSEKLPLFDTDTPQSRSNYEIISEVEFAPYYEDGHARYYAVKCWELFIWFASVYIVYRFDKSEQLYGLYITSSLAKTIITIFRTVFLDIPIAMGLASIISGRPRSFGKMFYNNYNGFFPRTFDDYMTKLIVGKNRKRQTQQQQQQQ